MDIKRYSKLIAAVLGIIAAVIADNVLDLSDLGTAIAMLIPAITVFFAPANTDPVPAPEG